MDELKQIIMHKLKLIQTYRNKQLQHLSIQQKTILTQILLKQKRKQNSRDVIESRLLQTLSTHRIEAPYRIQEFYNNSVSIMQVYSPDFEYKRNKKQQDYIEDIVNLYIKFFETNQCSRRAEQIKHIYQKKLCQRGIIIPTVFNWFVQWLRKIFKQFIRKKLNQLNDKNNSNLQENKKIRNKMFMEQINRHKQSLSVINSQIKLHKQKQMSLHININKSKLLSPSLVKTSRTVIKSQLQNYNNNSIQKLKANPNTLQQYYQKDLNTISPTKQIKQLTQQKQKQYINFNLNKDIFFSSFYQEIGMYYKFYACLGQVDDNYPRNFRKVDRRQEINRNLNILVKSIVRNQPNQIKNSIQRYSQAYYAKFGRNDKNDRNDKNQNKQQQIIKKMRKHLKKRSESVNIRKQDKQDQEDESPKKHDLSLDNQQRINRKKQTFPPPRTQAIKKKIQLELPDIKSKSINYKSIQKVILVHGNNQVPPSRYSRHKQEMKHRLSAQLDKQLREINSLFKNRNGKDSITFIGRASFESNGVLKNPIRFQKNPDEIEEILDGHFQADGIFRLPKIFK